MGFEAAAITFGPFETARILAEPIRADDFNHLLSLHSDPAVMATLGGVRSTGQTRADLDQALEHWRRHGYGIWTLRLKPDREFIGRAGLRHVAVGGNPEVELLYALRVEFWGRGLTTEAGREILRLAFTRLHLPNVVAFTLPTNSASRRVMEKLGFRFERDIMHAGMPHVLYRLRAADCALK